MTVRVYRTGDEGPVEFTDDYLEKLAQEYPLQLQRAGKWPKKKKSKRGAKKKLSPPDLEALRQETFRLLGLDGDPDEPDADPECNSRAEIIRRLKAFMAMPTKPDDHGPSKSTLKPLVNQWLDDWRALRVKG
jgi:hypothetical protein